MKLALLLVSFTTSSILQGCYGDTIINVANGVYSTKAESEGLHLPSTSTFKPIGALTIQLHLTSSYSVFVNYQITVDSSTDFWTKLQISRDDDGLTNVGSLVHYGNQAYKTATGYWMDNLEPGHYTFEVHYKSSSSISMAAGTDYQTAILQVMWFANVYAVSDGVRCYPNPYPVNRYGVLSPMKDLEFVPSAGQVVLARYQLPIYSSSKEWFSVRMHKNNQQLKLTIMSQGDNFYINLNSLLMSNQNSADYEFGLTYLNYYNSYFEDCRNNYQGSKNLYAMYLPKGCKKLINVKPKGPLSLSITGWVTTDLKYSFTLSQTEHVISTVPLVAILIIIVTRLLIDLVPVRHTAAITGNTYFAGNSGMWQGVINSGNHTITVQHRSGTTYTHYSGNGHERTTRSMDIVGCH